MARSQIDLTEAHQELAPISATERIRWADDQFGEDLWAMTSGGVQSAVMLRLIQKAGLQTPVALINTGNLHEEAIEYARQTTAAHDLPLHIVTSRWGEMDDDEARRKFREDPEHYAEVTKLEPARLLIARQGIKAFLSGVRAKQTENRAGMKFIDIGRDGELRIHPILDWTDRQVDEFMREEGLPEHPLSDEYGSLGDRINTVPGPGRSGRLLEGSECGLHRAPDGSLRRRAEALQTS